MVVLGVQSLMPLMVMGSNLQSTMTAGMVKTSCGSLVFLILPAVVDAFI